MVLLKLV